MIRIIDSFDKKSLNDILSRSQLNDNNLFDNVQNIIENVKSNGDKALFEYINKFDGITVDEQSITVSEDEIDAAYKSVDSDLLAALKRAKKNVLDYHNRQKDQYQSKIYDDRGNKLGWMYRPISKVGIYVPGGKASYPSSILMCALPAVAAGVEEIYIATPNSTNPLVLVAARECGIKKIFKMGGAQAIAAFTYGTKSVPQVDLIAGPGNVFVTLAKKAVYGHVAIDMIAGPSEILVIADDSANAEFVAADLLSQAEHDEMAAAILVTTSVSLAEKVSKEIEKQLAKSSRERIARKSIETNGAIITVKDIDEAVKIADSVAPEHLELCIVNAAEVAHKIHNAGAVFVGNYSPEPLGDYYAGPSHCLPTSGSARFFSVLNVGTFMKKISYIEFNRDSLLSVSNDIIAIAECEGLNAHANAIKIRKGK